MSSIGDLMCSICLDVFNDPVSTPCGHNFCKICLNTYWNNSQDYSCPNCNETFKQRPDLKINTTLRDVVDEHKRKSHEEQPEAEVVCDICTEGKLKAVKSCLVCQSSYCETHLESHLRVSGLQKHKLIDPVKNLQDYMCQKHDRPLELFCRDDRTCVCLICTEGDHKYHNTVPVSESELLETMEERQTEAETQDKYVIKYLEQEISEMKKRNIKLQMTAEKQRAAETQDKCLIKDLKKEIAEIQWRNNELEMVKQKQIIAENVIKVQDQEITELKKRSAELEMVKQKQIIAENVIKVRDQEITELKKRDAELKKRNAELKKRDAELVMVKQEQITAENVIKVRDQEITELKNINIVLKMTHAELLMANHGLVENVIKGQDQKITELKKRNTELKKRDAELKMVKQKQITAENVIKVQDQEITELKKRDTEQQLQISNTEDNLRHLQGQHQEYLSRQQKSSSEDLCSRIVGVVLLVLFIIASARLELLQKEFTELQKINGDLVTDMLLCKAARLEFTEMQKRNGDLETDMQRCTAARLELLQKEFTELQKRNCDLEPDMLLCKAELHLKLKQLFAVDVTLDPDTAHPKLILSDDKKQVRTGDIRHELPDNPKRFDRVPVVLGKEGFSSGRFYYEVQVKGKTQWILGVARESVNRKEKITDDGFWIVWLMVENQYFAFADPSVSLSLSVKPQKVGVFVDYEEGLVSFYDVENRSLIYSFTGQSFTERIYPVFFPGLNDEGKKPLIITPVIK